MLPSILLTLTLLFPDAIHSLPYGCGGTLSVLNVTQGTFRSLVWTCANISPSSLHASGQNSLIASSTKPQNTTACANYCSGYYHDGINAGVYYHGNSTCACWEYGDINTSPTAAMSSSNNATFIDFCETGSTYGPNSPQHWGKFTCPAGAYYNTVYQNGVAYRACYPLNILPGSQQTLSQCPSPNTQWELWQEVNGYNTIKCYAKLSGVQVGLNFSSTGQPKTLVDVLDSTTHSSTKAS